MKCNANVHTYSVTIYVAMHTVSLYSVYSVTMYTVITMYLYTVLTQCHLYSDTVFTVQSVTMQCVSNLTKLYSIHSVTIHAYNVTIKHTHEISLSTVVLNSRDR